MFTASDTAKAGFTPLFGGNAEDFAPITKADDDIILILPLGMCPSALVPYGKLKNIWWLRIVAFSENSRQSTLCRSSWSHLK
jgi:hypothetical protein